ncbi:hypothetical protein FHU41_000316 [Psychromicrobium silvestre]|uniref:Integral membrane protein n=1 Tax=Psychromicrobium silvestre TaxID=1645614 RepID=A0A7Y9LR73_9MICC|nr:hypothetical protein [Psychromicrobium silvestre]NYE94095.1 hypothetical protein [Psychromicrobium silvestre]
MAQSTIGKSRYATEEWFRRQGLPYFVTPRDRSRHLLARSAPTLFYFALLAFALALTSHSTLLTKDSDAISDEEAWLVLVMLAAVILLPLGCALLALRLLRGRTGAARLTALASFFLLLVVDPLLTLGATADRWWDDILASLLVLAIVLLLILALTWLGVGSLLGWSLRAAIRQLSAIWLLAAIALPLLILVVISVFYAQEFWQVAATLQRGQVFWLIVFLLSIGMLFLIYSTRKELRDMPATLNHEDVSNDPGEDEPKPQGNWSELNRAKQANIVLVMVLAQCFQVLIFGVLVFAFIMALNALSVPQSLAVQWAGKPSVDLQLLGISLPVPEVPVRVAAFLSAIAALNFVVSINSSKEYRDAFFDPLIVQTQRALTTHAEYQRELILEKKSSERARDKIDSEGSKKAVEEPAQTAAPELLSEPDDIVEP